MASLDGSLVIDVPAELFAPAESSSFDGVYNPGTFEFGPDTYECREPLTWNAMVSNVGGALLVTGTVTGDVLTTCGRCLDDVTYGIDADLEGYFIIPGQGDEPEDMDEDEFDILPETNQIDFEPIIKAAIDVSLPLVPLCDEDCKGLCAHCGANLNEGPCGCESNQAYDDEPKTASGKPSQFAALKDFKFE